MTQMPLDSRLPSAPTEFEALVQQIRPELHQYCARMVGSVVDAEDVVQEALAKAYASLPTTEITNLRGWLFRIAHNKAIDHLRHSRRSQLQQMDYLDENALSAEPDSPLMEQELVAIALSVFLKLAPKQRSCVILKDVMGYSLAEISELLDATVPEIKAALHRGRTRLRELASLVDEDAPTLLDEPERVLLARYIDRFNARDFDAVRTMLADEVRLDLVNRLARRGVAEVGEYFHRYDQSHNWYLTLGTIENRPAILVSDPNNASAQPVYFMLITWRESQISLIRDYRYVPYVLTNATMQESL